MADPQNRAIHRQAATVIGALKVCLDEGQQALTALKNPWQELELRTSASPFISYEWCKLQAKSHSRPVIASVWRERHCIAILPLALAPIIKKARLTGLVHLCQSFTDYQFMLCEDSVTDCLAAIVKHLGASSYAGMPLLFRYPAESLAHAFRELNSKGVVNIDRFHYWSHVGYEANKSQIKPKVFADANRRKRKLEEAAKVRYELNHPYDPTLIDWVLDSNRAKHGKNNLNDETKRQSVHELLESYQTQVSLSAIYDGEIVVAAHLGFKQKKTLWYYVPVANPAYRQYSPGIILLSEIIQNLEQFNLDAIDYLRGEEPYKKKWGNVESRVSGLLCYPASFNPWRDLLLSLWIRRNQ